MTQELKLSSYEIEIDMFYYGSIIAGVHER